MPDHAVKPGEYLSLIADQAAFRSAATVWDDSGNADLRATRDNPDVLAPDDTLFVPDKQVKKLPRPTGARHDFRVKTDTLRLRLQILDFDDVPVANQAGTLEVGDVTHDVTTDDDGRIDQKVPRDVRSGMLRLPDIDLTLQLDIGMLDPIDTDAGWQARLVNLGYFRGEAGDGDQYDEHWSWSLEEYQCDHGLDVTGEADDATRASLLDMHGS